MGYLGTWSATARYRQERDEGSPAGPAGVSGTALGSVATRAQLALATTNRAPAISGVCTGSNLLAALVLIGPAFAFTLRAVSARASPRGLAPQPDAGRRAS